MEDQTNEPEVVEEVEEAEEETSEPTDDINELKARLKKFEEKGITQRERTRALKAEIEKLKKATTPKAEKEEKKTGELDDNALDYLDLKGITETEDIDVIQKVVARTGQTVRQVLKDDYVQEKLKANQAKREVAAATPSGTKRSGNSQEGDVSSALAKYEQTGELPSDFKLRSAVINAKLEKESGNKPSWH